MNLSTNAKELAIKFYSLTDSKITAPKMAKAVSVFKRLLLSYSNSEIEYALEYFIKTKRVDVYSPGFFCVGNVMEEAKQKYDEANAHRERLKEHEVIAKTIDRKGDSSERNRAKASKSHSGSRRREKYNFDMFK